MLLEWWTRGKPSVLGMISGAVAGLGTITPASGFVLPWHGVVIGLIAGRGLLLGLHLAEAVARLRRFARRVRRARHRRRDRHAAHRRVRGRGAVGEPGRAGIAGLLEGNPRQLLIQLYGVVAVLLWSGVLTYVLLKVIAFLVPLRVSEQHEIEGLDLTQHGEALQ